MGWLTILRGVRGGVGAEGCTDPPSDPDPGVSFLAVISCESRKPTTIARAPAECYSVPHGHSAEVETEAQRGQVTRPEPHSW